MVKSVCGPHARLARFLARQRSALGPLSGPAGALKADIETYGWRIGLLSFVSCWFVFTLAPRLAGTLELLSLGAPVLLVLAQRAVIWHGARRIVAAHQARARPLKPPARSVRISAPYERMAPVASATCSRCPALAGQRHTRSCPAIPAGWFNNQARSGPSR